MRVNCIINGKSRSFDVDPSMRLRQMLLLNGNFAVRDSDDCEGFCGSDTVLVDGTPVYANLVLAGEVDGCEIRTPDGLGNPQNLTVVQKAMIDAGVVQSAYNAPAAALLLTWLLENNPEWDRVIVFARTRHSADRVLELAARVVYLGPTAGWPRRRTSGSTRRR